MLRLFCCEHKQKKDVDGIYQNTKLENECIKGDLETQTTISETLGEYGRQSLVDIAVKVGPPKSHLKSIDTKLRDQLNANLPDKLVVIQSSDEWRKFFFDYEFNFNETQISNTNESLNKGIDMKLFELEIAIKTHEIEKTIFEELMNKMENLSFASTVESCKQPTEKTDSLYDYFTKSKDTESENPKTSSTKTNTVKLSTDVISINVSDSETVSMPFARSWIK